MGVKLITKEAKSILCSALKSHRQLKTTLTQCRPFPGIGLQLQRAAECFWERRWLAERAACPDAFLRFTPRHRTALFKGIRHFQNG